MARRVEVAEPGQEPAELHRARAAAADQRFADAVDAYARAGPVHAMAAEDLLAWSGAAWWLGRSDEALELAELGHRRLLADGSTTRAAQEAIGMGFLLLLRGRVAEGSGWVQRGRSLLERSPDDVADGYLAQLDAEGALEGGELATAVEAAGRAAAVARRCGDPTLLALSLMTGGTARLRRGSARALAMLDEAMVSVRAGEVPPEFVGNMYCRMIAVCWELGDLRRAREWTATTERWCAGFESAAMFSGICRMHQVQLRQLSGEWETAAEQAARVCTELVRMNTGVVAEGHYLRGDLMRLRGRHAEARAAYRRAHELGRDPQPGLALLTAQEGRPDAALTALRTSLAAHRGAEYARAPLLRAAVDVALDGGDLDTARVVATELGDLARRWPAEALVAAAAQALGAVELAAGEPALAVGPLREAVATWRGLEAPYECARARVVLAGALAALGDASSARLELEVAERTLTGLGAVDDLRRLPGARDGSTEVLTAREAEVLALVARGDRNREVADALGISEKTVARHLANVYLKLGVSTRTAAAAWARHHGPEGDAT